MLDESIPLTTGEFDEWGNPKNEKSYHYMLSYSPYDNVKALEYPHLGNDWIAIAGAVLGARSSKVTHREAGQSLVGVGNRHGVWHGGASGRYERYRRKAMEYAFFLYVLGLADK